MTLSDDIVTDASSVFLDTDDFAESIKFYKRGKRDTEETVTAIVNRDHEEGTREAHGDGVVNEEHRAGYALRKSLVIEVLATTDITDPPDDMAPDMWKIDNEMWASKRVLGRDDGLVGILVVRKDRVSSRGNPRSG